MKHPAHLPLLFAAVLLQPLAAPRAFAAEKTAVSISESDTSREDMSMLAQPSVSPDGKTIAFAWNGDIWTMAVTGGVARRLTGNDAEDSQPVFSPDGRQIAFASRRIGNVSQVFVMPASGGVPRQITFNTGGSLPVAWEPDSKSLIITGLRDQAPNNYKPAMRFFRVNLEKREREEMLFDDYGASGSLSPDGTKLLFTREDHDPYRMGYHGSQAGQVWLYDLTAKTFRLILKSETGYRSPVWRPDGAAFYCLDNAEGAYNLAECELAGGKLRAITHGKSDNCYSPAVGGDNGALVFRRGFDLFAVDPRKGGEPRKIEVYNLADNTRDNTVRRTLRAASEAAFSGDGLETFFVAGGDLWVMDTTLAEPHAIAGTAAEESSPALSPDGKSLFFLRDEGATEDVFVATRSDAKKFWWENESFAVKRLTTDGRAKSGLRLSPDGKRVAFARDRGDLVVIDTDGSGERVLLKAWNIPEFSWSPDGRWIAYAVEDNDFNRDIWIVPADGSSAPVNVSRHPDSDTAPSWSPDGTALAWIRRQGEDKFFLDFVRLTKEADQLSARDRKIEAAHEKMEKERTAKKTPGEKPRKVAEKEAAAAVAPSEVSEKTKTAPDAAKVAAEEKSESDTKTADTAKTPETKIDFDGLHRRVRSAAVPFSAKFDGLVWTNDSKKVGYRGETGGKAGIIGLEISKIEDTRDLPAPGAEKSEGKVELIISADLRGIRSLDKGKGFAGLTQEGLPAVIATGKDAPAAQKFSARQEYDGVARRRVAFLYCWRYMRDNFYDAKLNNRDWNAIRAKYEEHAAQAVDTLTFDRVTNMMLGELNASHLGYRALPPAAAPASEWKVETADLGLHFDSGYAGPGWRVAEVVEEGPADRVRSRVDVGDIVLAVDGTTVTPKQDPTELLNGDLARDIALRVRGADGKERTVVLRPESLDAIRKKARAQRLRETADAVDKLSGGRLGYVYIAQMNWESFRVFEKAIYEQGHGKDGLIIDVRDNGGGFTADHLMTILCQPRHAITVPRDGGPGYPQDRHVYVAWNKPIVVLTNQNSFSNAEVFAHAVKNAGRGKLVGVATAGGVISTGATGVLDFGTLRSPGRGWYGIHDGLDYELNGAKPDYEVWNLPGDAAANKDRQLEKAVEVLLKDVSAQKPLPKLIDAHANGR